MQLHRTTIRLPAELVDLAQEYALNNKTTLQEVHTKALKKFLADEQVKQATLLFKTKALGKSWSGLTRAQIYE